MKLLSLRHSISVIREADILSLQFMIIYSAIVASYLLGLKYKTIGYYLWQTPELCV